MQKLKKTLSDPMLYCRALYAVAFFHLIMGALHSRQTPAWFLPSNMPPAFTSRQVVAEIWTIGLLILGTLELGLAYLISFTVRITRAVADALSEGKRGKPQ